MKTHSKKDHFMTKSNLYYQWSRIKSEKLEVRK